jgi:hypothetical protein
MSPIGGRGRGRPRHRRKRIMPLIFSACPRNPATVAGREPTWALYEKASDHQRVAALTVASSSASRAECRGQPLWRRAFAMSGYRLRGFPKAALRKKSEGPDGDPDLEHEAP